MESGAEQAFPSMRNRNTYVEPQFVYVVATTEGYEDRRINSYKRLLNFPLRIPIHLQPIRIHAHNAH